MVAGDEKWRYFSPAISSPGAYVHSGAGGINLWIDPANELVVVYMEVTMKITENLEPVTWSFDYFHGVLISALDD
jgi:CubicO group peptidase (beta-lactamase class C family)